MMETMFPELRKEQVYRIRCLSLWQPWASFMALGLKSIETRSWSGEKAGLRGGELLVVHASVRRLTREDREEWADLLDGLGLTPETLPYGQVLSVHRYQGSEPTERLSPALGLQEVQMGNYKPGRFGWRMPRLLQLEQPLSLKGMQGVFWWRPPADLAPQLRALENRR